MKIALVCLSVLVAFLGPGAGGGQALAADRRGRLGIGLSHQLKNQVPALSFKLQQSRSFSLGGLLGYRNRASESSRYGAGLKFYRNFFEEPQLNFYGALLAAWPLKVDASGGHNNFQLDFALGSEFHFAGLESLGFGLEFGLSAYKIGRFAFETVGDKFIVSSAHFYL